MLHSIRVIGISTFENKRTPAIINFNSISVILTRQSFWYDHVKFVITTLHISWRYKYWEMQYITSIRKLDDDVWYHPIELNRMYRCPALGGMSR